jgi:hypothetical protein
VRVLQSRHCLLNVQPTAADTLRKAHIYPICLLIKHKTFRHIKYVHHTLILSSCSHIDIASLMTLPVYRDTKDGRFLPDKLPSKAAKELFELFKDYDIKYKRYFAGE